ncbi:MAG: hypothetical protein UX81_C0018G0007 [Parcubacteria group bacterium GW2011_GWA2_47_12]|nr:MAG: hypothetical protein UX81_C0018G0007 [Parcubacteria group bacterium GW2011_GWA2_47_12]
MKKFIFSLFFASPFLVFAQTLRNQLLLNPAARTPLGNIVLILLDLLSLVSFIVGALTLIWFFWGIIQYVLKADNEEKQTEARSYMIYAVIGMFVMFSIFGLVNLVRNTFFLPGSPFIRLNPGDIPIVPRLPTGNTGT